MRHNAAPLELTRESRPNHERGRSKGAFAADQLYRSSAVPFNAAAESGVWEKLDAMLSEQLIGMAQNRLTASIGTDGRHSLDYADRSSRMSVALGLPWQLTLGIHV